jgi:UDP-3-O-[3-hydroxymyristoyl] glucosamine N-acyltransferase
VPPTITTGHLASVVGARLIGDAALELRGMESVDLAGPGHLTFIRQAKFAHDWKTGRASAALVASSIPLDRVLADVAACDAGPGRAVLIVPDVDLAMIAVLKAFMPQHAPAAAGVHPKAYAAPSARVHPTASIGPGCAIGPEASVGEGSVLVANVCLGHGATVGASCVLHPGVTVYDRCVVGDRCILHACVTIGADGFGYHPSPDGKGLLKIPHVGNAVIEHDVEIGANSCVDRAKMGTTLVGAGTKIDNLVQIGHNCRVGRCCILCGQSGLAGSVTLGDGVVLGGRVAVSDGVSIGSGAKIGGMSAVAGDIPSGQVYMGIPAIPATEWRRTFAAIRRLGKDRAAVKGE